MLIHSEPTLEPKDSFLQMFNQQHFSKLQELELYASSDSDATFLSQCLNLRTLSVRHLFYLTDPFVMSLPASLVHLSLSIGRIPRFIRSTELLQFGEALSRLVNLETLQLTGLVHSKQLTAFPRCSLPKLKVLKLLHEGTDILGMDMTAIEQFHSLESLQMYGIRVTGFPLLPTSLKDVRVDDCILEVNILHQFKQTKCLKRFSFVTPLPAIHQKYMLPTESPNLTNLTVDMSADFDNSNSFSIWPKLEQVSVSNHSSLEEVDFNGCSQLSTVDFFQLSSLETIKGVSSLCLLTSISLSGCPFLTELPDLSCLPMLASLTLQSLQCVSKLDLSPNAALKLIALYSLETLRQLVLPTNASALYIQLGRCYKLTHVIGFSDDIAVIKKFKAHHCPLLRNIPDAANAEIDSK